MKEEFDAFRSETSALNKKHVSSIAELERVAYMWMNEATASVGSERERQQAARRERRLRGWRSLETLIDAEDLCGAPLVSNAKDSSPEEEDM